MTGNGFTKGFVALGLIGLLLAGRPAQAIQCAIFARAESGLRLHGDAWTWWDQAKSAYQRGHQAKVGSVLVFRQTGSMRHGHVAVVTAVVNSRKIYVDHANWNIRGVRKGAVAKHMAIIDDSPKNDWTKVRVWYRPANEFGKRAYPTYGFIYRKPSKAFSADAIEAANSQADALIEVKFAQLQ